MPQYSAGKVVTETGGLVSLAVPYVENEREWPLDREYIVQGEEDEQEDGGFVLREDIDFGEDIYMDD